MESMLLSISHIRPMAELSVYTFGLSIDLGCWCIECSKIVNSYDVSFLFELLHSCLCCYMYAKHRLEVAALSTASSDTNGRPKVKLLLHQICS